MGVYDNYAGCQMKVGNPCCKDFKIGDNVKIPNGVYIAYEGLVIIKDGKLDSVLEFMYDKWGGKIDSYKLMELVRYKKFAKKGIKRGIKKIMES
jgi:hypothetical protein